MEAYFRTQLEGLVRDFNDAIIGKDLGLNGDGLQLEIHRNKSFVELTHGPIKDKNRSDAKWRNWTDAENQWPPAYPS